MSMENAEHAFTAEIINRFKMKQVKSGNMNVAYR